MNEMSVFCYLPGHVDLGTSPQVIIFRMRYSSKFRLISNYRVQRHRLPSKKEKVSNELKTSKVKFIHLGTFMPGIVDMINTKNVSKRPME